MKPLFVAILLTFFSVAAFPKTIVGVSEIPSLLTQAHQPPGPYNHVLNNLDDIEVLYMPPARAEVVFADKRVDCLFPGSTKTMANGDELLQSLPVQSVNAYIFTEEPYDDPEALGDLTLGGRRGFTFGNFEARFSGTYIELPSDLAAFTMLHKKRIQAVIAYLPDAIAAQKRLKVQPAFYAPEKPVYTTIEAFVCYPSSRQFIQSVNNKIKSWRDSGQLDSWLSMVEAQSF